jgi:hypothetical protein
MLSAVPQSRSLQIFVTLLMALSARPDTHVMKFSARFECKLDLSLIVSIIGLIVGLLAWLGPAR